MCVWVYVHVRGGEIYTCGSQRRVSRVLSHSPCYLFEVETNPELGDSGFQLDRQVVATAHSNPSITFRQAGSKSQHIAIPGLPLNPVLGF